MQLGFIPLANLSVSKANMRYAKKAPEVSDILPTVRRRGVIVPILVRPNGEAGHFEIVAGARRFHAASLVAAERREAGEPEEAMPCAILDDGDDAAAIEASMIENMARLDADEVSQWESFVRLVKEGRKIDDIAATFGLPELSVRRILALGNLLPRIRDIYRREAIDAVTVRHLTMASKGQQRAWLALYDDPEAYAPHGHQLKQWLFGGASIIERHALFDVPASGLAMIADLFGEDRYFADRDAFWAAQDAEIAVRRAAYLEEGWADVVTLAPNEHFHSWEYERAAKRKGGRVYVEVRTTGEVIFHEGYLTRAEAKRHEAGETSEPSRAARPEVTSTLDRYVALHRHATVRLALTSASGVALRLMVAHAIAGAQFWRVEADPQGCRNEDVRASLDTSPAQIAFIEKRRAVLSLLGFDADAGSLVGFHREIEGDAASAIFARLLDLPDPAIMEVIAVVAAETLASGSAMIEAVGLHLGIDMAAHWTADAAFFECVRDREVLRALVAEVAGPTVAEANAKESGKTLKHILSDHLEGTNGRTRVTSWVPRWMAFPPAAYTTRGGVGSVAAHAAMGRIVPEEVDAAPLPMAA